MRKLDMHYQIDLSRFLVGVDTWYYLLSLLSTNIYLLKYEYYSSPDVRGLDILTGVNFFGKETRVKRDFNL